MKSKYPIVLVHGLAVKDFKIFRAFGKIEKTLQEEGYRVYTAEIDGFGTVENNAAQLKSYIEGILGTEKVEKVNLIAHSKGGLDAKYMVQHLDMEDKVASLTTLCTPHKGASLATKLLKMPKFLLYIIAFFINFWYRIFGDKRPDALKACQQLQVTPHVETVALHISEKVYCQSYSSVLDKGREDFVMDVPLMLLKKFDERPSDGLVSVESAQFANYKGHCMEESVSHSEIIDLMTKKKKKEKIFAFYRQVCFELTEMGF